MSSDPQAVGPLASPGFWLHRAGLAWLADLDQRPRPLGLAHTQFALLAASWLAGTQGPPTRQDVAEFAGADRMMTSKVVRALEHRGLLSQIQLPPATPHETSPFSAISLSVSYASNASQRSRRPSNTSPETAIEYSSF